MHGDKTPPYTGLMTPDTTPLSNAVPAAKLGTTVSLSWESSRSATIVHDTPVLLKPARTKSVASSVPMRLRQDLLILTSFNDNSTLYWRPQWFSRGSFPGSMWTLHNPPNVVTEQLPNDCKGDQLFTRRMRQTNDPPPLYIKSWEHWWRYCDLYGVPHDFLSEEQVQLMRTGLPRSPVGSLCSMFPRLGQLIQVYTNIQAPPQYPLYPEPLREGSYVLTQSICSTRLPLKFQHVISAAPDPDSTDAEVVVVESDGTLAVKPQKECSTYGSNRGHRWSYIPWTKEMEDSYRPLTVKLRLWNEGLGEMTNAST